MSSYPYEGELGNVKPDVLNLGPVTADLIERVKKLESAKVIRRVEHPPKVEQINFDPLTIQEKLREAGLIPESGEKPLTGLVNIRGEKAVTVLLFVNVDVGQLPPFKAEALLERMMDRWKAAFDRLPEHVAVLYQPVRGAEHAGIQIVTLPSQ